MAGPTTPRKSVQQQPFTRVPVRDLSSAVVATNDIYDKLAVNANLLQQHVAAIQTLQAQVAALIKKVG